MKGNSRTCSFGDDIQALKGERVETAEQRNADIQADGRERRASAGSP